MRNAHMHTCTQRFATVGVAVVVAALASASGSGEAAGSSAPLNGTEIAGILLAAVGLVLLHWKQRRLALAKAANTKEIVAKQGAEAVPSPSLPPPLPVEIEIRTVTPTLRQCGRVPHFVPRSRRLLLQLALTYFVCFIVSRDLALPPLP